MLCITSKVDGYRRCGVLHPARRTEYEDDKFTAQELAVLQADPLLTVEAMKAEPIEPPEEPANQVGHLDREFLESMSVAKLRRLATDMELDLPDKATKKQLVELIAKEPVTVDDALVEGAGE